MGIFLVVPKGKNGAWIPGGIVPSGAHVLSKTPGDRFRLAAAADDFALCCFALPLRFAL